MEDHIHPAISRIQARLEAATGRGRGNPVRKPAGGARDLDRGAPVPAARATSRCSWPSFADDPELSGADLIYVLDSPQQEEELRNYAADLFPIYHVPFRVAVLERNAGFAGRLQRRREPRTRAAAPAAELRRATRPARLARRDARLLRRDSEDRRAGAEAALRGRLDPARRHVLLQPARLEGLGRLALLQGHAPHAPRRKRRAPRTGGLRRLHDDRPGPLRGVRRIAGHATCRATTRTSTSASSCRRRATRTGTCPRPSSTTSKAQSYTPDARRPANRYNMWLHTHIWGERIAAIMADGPSDVPG